jgi:diguanylate cyclase (GGDEF)-like protein
MINGKRASDHPLSLLYLDLDRFKEVNDNGGHAAGDELLRQITRLMLLRTRETDMVARMGGDEFAVLLIACPSNAAERIAESIRNSIQSYRLVWEGKTYQVGASIGVVHAPPTWETLDDCLNAADAAAYRAKELGRNRVVIHRHEESRHA